MTSNDRNLVTSKKPGTVLLMQNVDLGHTKVIQIRQRETLSHQGAIIHENCCSAAQSKRKSREHAKKRITYRVQSSLVAKRNLRSEISMLKAHRDCTISPALVFMNWNRWRKRLNPLPVNQRNIDLKKFSC